MTRKKVLITGCGGMLGQAVRSVFKDAGHDVHATDIRLNEEWLHYLDVSDSGQVDRVVRETSPDLILHLAAETDMELCELRPDAAYKVNVLGAGLIAGQCAKRGLTMVHISTAGVFSGTKGGPYVEEDAPCPLSVYGRTKNEGHLMASSILDKLYVFRPGWMFGGGAKDKKFVGHVVRQVKAGKKEIHAVTDKCGSPTYTWDLARLILLCVESGLPFGLYHAVCKGGEISRHDMAEFILGELGRRDIVLTKCRSDYFMETFHAPRPPSETLANARLDGLGKNIFKTWREAVREYLKREYELI